MGKQTRRNVIKSGIASSLLLSLGGTAVGEDRDENTESGDGNETTTVQQDTSLVEAVTTPEFSEALVDAEFSGVGDQAETFQQELQGFPIGGNEFTLLSSGRASDAPNDPEFFASTDVGGESIANYSPDNFDANNVATLSFDFVVPEGAQGVAFDWKFGTEESPSFLGSTYQDFFEAVLITPDGSFRNIALLPDETPVTVDNADSYANTPSGDSQEPEQPLPDPPDVAYNAVTELQTASGTIGAYEGQTVRLRIRIADATDGVYDSAVFLDNLRFLGEIDDIDASLTPAVEAMNRYQEAVDDALSAVVWQQAYEDARLFADVGEPDDAIEYFGIKAGELDQGMMDEELFEEYEKVLGELPQDEAGELYEFTQSMYAQVDPDDGVTAIAESFASKYWNDYPGTDQSLDQFSDEFNETFDAYREDILDQLSGEEYSQSDIDHVASFWNNRAIEAEREAAEYVRDSSDLIKTFVEDGEITGHLVAAERDSVETQGGVSPDAIGLTVLAALLIKKAAASGVAAKALTTATGAAKAAGGHAVGIGAAAGTTALKALKAAHAFHHAHKWGVFSLHLAVEFILKMEPAGGPHLPEADEPLPDDVDEIIELEQRDAVLTAITTNDVDLLDKIFSGDGIDVGTEVGSITVVNSGASTFTPDIQFAIEAENIPPAGESVETGYPVQLTEPVPELSPGESATIDVEYVVPVGVFTSDFKLVADVPEQDTQISDSFESGVLQLPNITSQTLDEGTISDGDYVGTTTEPDPDTESLTFDLEYSQLNCDLHIYDDDVDPSLPPSAIDANHVGFNYTTNEFENNIAGTTVSGPDDGVLGEEYVSIGGLASNEYTAQVIAPEIETVIQGESSDSFTVQANQSDRDGATTITAGKQKTVGVQDTDPDIEYSVEETSVEPAPATISFGVETLNAEADRGETLELERAVSEAAGFESLSDVTLTVDDLEGERESDIIGTEAISVAGDGVDIEAGGSETITVTIDVPEDIEPDFYGGEFLLSSETETESVPIDLNVEMHPSGVSEEQANATLTDGEDTTLEQLRDSISEWIDSDGQIGDVELSLEEIRDVVDWWVDN